ncbi:hypothetical protein EES43_22570 [Streptomyces sp. ADI96-02]|uniref:hypothetical protein n=1 Tax=unclassified Streptomyces TaxID=2593676 RepID=UPI000F550B59|nr:hypothetical protein [Streptomyces sp. ADI96-02]RPK57181.1 hypothetical protein EES43_22570 [Streptomyces sp. ADI96-02]
MDRRTDNADLDPSERTPGTRPGPRHDGVGTGPDATADAIAGTAVHGHHDEIGGTGTSPCAGALA